MNEQELLRELESQNRWWAEKTIELETGLIERDVYEKLLKELERKEVTGIIGLRRTGKTTILRQTIKSLLEKGTDPRKIMFLSFDGFKKEERIVKQVMDIYFRHILEMPANDIEGRVYVFFDEVQKVEEWGEEIKSFYDKGHKIKFFVSGSSSMNILRGSGESLIGRINLHKIFPFTFREFLSFSGIETGKQDASNFRYPRESEHILILFSRYLRLGGFPELYSLPEQEIKGRLRTFMDLTFYRDIVNIFEVKRPDVLEGLFLSLLQESGSIANYSNLSSSLNTKFETLKTYMEYLSYSFLISQSRYFSRSRKHLEKNAKIYVSDHSFSALSGTKEGLKIETVVYNHCKSLLDSGDIGSISYWRDRKNEVDIVLSTSKGIIPVEVKYREDPERLSGLLKFMEKFSVKRGIIVTKDLFGEKEIEGRHIQFVPAWLFCLAA